MAWADLTADEQRAYAQARRDYDALCARILGMSRDELEAEAARVVAQRRRSRAVYGLASPEVPLGADRGAISALTDDELRGVILR